MDALSQLESRVDQLIARLEILRAENTRLGEELTQAAQENIHLATQNRALRRSLDQEIALRQAALGRLQALLEKIRAYGAAG